MWVAAGSPEGSRCLALRAACGRWAAALGAVNDPPRHFSRSRQSIVTLAAAIITASGRPWSIEQALALSNDIHFAMYPAPNNGAYQEWAKTKNAKLMAVHDRG